MDSCFCSSQFPISTPNSLLLIFWSAKIKQCRGREVRTGKSSLVLSATEMFEHACAFKGLLLGLVLSVSDCNLLANPPLRPDSMVVHNSPSWSPSTLPAESLWPTQHPSSHHSLWCSVYTWLLPKSSLLILYFAQSNLALAFPSVVRHYTRSINPGECISSLQKSS